MESSIDFTFDWMEMATSNTQSFMKKFVNIAQLENNMTMNYLYGFWIFVWTKTLWEIM